MSDHKFNNNYIKYRNVPDKGPLEFATVKENFFSISNWHFGPPVIDAVWPLANCNHSVTSNLKSRK